MRSPAVQFIFIVLAAMSAFTLGPAKSGVRDAAQALFLPVAVPTRAVGIWATRRVSPTIEADPMSPESPRNVEAIRLQNNLLLGRLARLEAQLDDTRQQLAHYQTLDADLRDRVRQANVLAGPTATHQTLTIAAVGHAVRERQPVIDPKGFVGQIYTVAPGGATARVLLATDPESRLTARFERLVTDEANGARIVRVDTPPPLVEGNGHSLSVKTFTARQVREVLRVGDVAVLNDPAFPPIVNGLRVGTISKITLPSTYDGFVDIELRPVTDLPLLREVLIVER